ncbi:MAG TPA: sulfatase-like hydrolase/transferase [Pirellulaceae bacterium]|nr:sulfatase-like hydrolase/transferase [Pirellulaceae bacterium]
MLSRHVVVVVIDRLGAGWLGPYGNTWLETPHFNRLAASALLCETAIADSPELLAAYRSYWTGRHAFAPDGPDAESLPKLASAEGHKTILVTDDGRIAAHPQSADFGEIRRVSAEPRAAAATSIDGTGLFQLTTAALEALAESAERSLVWIHSRGMDGPWDAPLELRNQFADEDDPEPPQLVQPPALVLPENYDPDALLGLTQAYAGQVALADECLGLLLEVLGERRPDETLLIVTSPRGYPLGEHRRVGDADPALYAELLQVPLLVRFPATVGALVRAQTIVQPQSVYATIVGAKGSGDLASLVAGESLPGGEAAVSVAEGQRSIRTPAWFLRESQRERETERELYAKPDDRWEANEVASRCGETADLLAARMDEFQSAARAGSLAGLPPLTQVLADGWR